MAKQFGFKQNRSSRIASVFPSDRPKLTMKVPEKITIMFSIVLFEILVQVNYILALLSILKSQQSETEFWTWKSCNL